MPDELTTLYNGTTRQSLKSGEREAKRPVLTVLFHPDVARIGEVALIDLTTPTMVSRASPVFAQLDGPNAKPRALGDPCLSRQPLVIRAIGPNITGPLSIEPPVSVITEVDGKSLVRARSIEPAEIDHGVVIVLAERVVLLLQYFEEIPCTALSRSIIGRSSTLLASLECVCNVAKRERPLVLSGESGVGKRLVASEFARLVRPDKPYLSLDCGTMQTWAAGSGARPVASLSDRVESVRNVLEQADKGTLLLNQVDQLTVEAQSLVLGFLQDGERQISTGGTETLARIIATLDVPAGSSKETIKSATPLVSYLKRFQIDIPPLRKRRDDIGRLVVCFLERELRSMDGWCELARADWRQRLSEWLSAPYVSALAGYDFPGNVRELRDIVGQTVTQSSHKPRAHLPTQTLDVSNNSAVEGEKGSMTDRRKVFVVHGRNAAARDAIFQFLRSVDLDPIEWEAARTLTQNPNAYVGEILGAGFGEAQAILVLLTGDDEARLREKYRSHEEPQYETELTRQARPNVLFEAGLAFGRAPQSVVLVEVGRLRPFSDIAGRYVVRLKSGAASERHLLVERLRDAGCLPDTKGRTDWLERDFFRGLLNDE